MSAAVPQLFAIFLSTVTAKESANLVEPDSTAGNVQAQQREIRRATIESLLDWSGDELPTGALEELGTLEVQPLDLNMITREELEAIPGVTPGEAVAFLDFRSHIRKLTSVQQVRGIGDGGEEFLRKIELYVNVSSGQPAVVCMLARASVRESYLADRKEVPELGSPAALRWRIDIAPLPGCAAGVMIDKDPGERMCHGLVSGYVDIHDLPFESRIIIGDFVFEAGQGLVSWNSSAAPKGVESIAGVHRAGGGVRPSHSADEFRFFRGVGLSTALPRGLLPVELSVVLSRRSLAATLDDVGRVSGFSEEGVFATEAALRKRSAVREEVMGFRLTFTEGHRFKAGLSYLSSSFDHEFAPGQKWDIPSPHIASGSLDLTATSGSTTFFGEFAVSGNTPAWNGGMILEWPSTASLSLLYRHYPAEFVSPHGNGFADGGKTANEQGIYFGWHVRLNQWLTFRGSLDAWKTPWRTFRDPLPVGAQESLLGCEGEVPHVVKILLQYRRNDRKTTRTTVDPSFREVKETLTRRQERVRLAVEVPLGGRVNVRARVDLAAAQYLGAGSLERSSLVSEEISFPVAPRVTATLHYALFDAPSYVASVYEFERDLPGVYKSPALYGKGERWYLVVRGSILPGIRLSAKLAATHCDGERLSGGSSQVVDEQMIGIQLDVVL